MWVSITLGAVQLSLAHLWKAKAAFPKISFLSEVGWAVWLWGMFGLVAYFLLKAEWKPDQFPYYQYLLYIGGGLAIIFAAPDRNPLKMIGLGLANFPLSAIGTFGDTVSYVRLMAIGLAGSALAMAFNDMGGSLPWYAMIPILMAGHAMNTALSIISLLVHGVRLNMLEFSNNLGMQWSGYAYEPFTKHHSEEA
jgi:V/A-type H+-transporting ATPase subunit I